VMHCRLYSPRDPTLREAYSICRGCGPYMMAIAATVWITCALPMVITLLLISQTRTLT
jgi:hypothetical protein